MGRISLDLENKYSEFGVEFLKFAEFQLDSHTIYLSSRDVIINDIPYEGHIIDFGNIKNSREIEAGFEQTQTTQIVINNAEYKFQDIIENQEITNRIVIIREAETTIDNVLVDTGTYIDLLYGVIGDYFWDDNKFHLEITDISRKIHQELPKYDITTSVWANAVDVGKPYPIIGGLVTKAPIYLVDNVAYQYLACMIPSGHTIKSAKGDGTFKVYYWDTQTGSPGSSSGGEWVEVNTANYAVSKTTDTDDVGVFIIDFTVDMSNFELAIDIEGIEDDSSGTYTGIASSLITNHADFARLLYQHSDFLNRDVSEINVPSFTVARNDLKNDYTNPPTLSWWIGERKNSVLLFDDLGIAMRRSVARINMADTVAGGLRTISLNIIKAVNNKSSKLICDKNNILSEVVINKRPTTEIINEIIINGDKNHAQNEFRKTAKVNNSKSITRYKNTNTYTYNCLTLSNQAEMNELANDLLTMEINNNNAYFVEFDLNKSYVLLERGDVVLLTADNAPGRDYVKIGARWEIGDGTKVSEKIYDGWKDKRIEILSIERQNEKARIKARTL